MTPHSYEVSLSIFLQPTRGQTPQPILTQNGLIDMNSRKNCNFLKHLTSSLHSIHFVFNILSKQVSF